MQGSHYWCINNYIHVLATNLIVIIDCKALFYFGKINTIIPLVSSTFAIIVDISGTTCCTMLANRLNSVDLMFLKSIGNSPRTITIPSPGLARCTKLMITYLVTCASYSESMFDELSSSRTFLIWASSLTLNQAQYVLSRNPFRSR